jgi:UDP-GlcNAc:undecaprenyl-phosphate/decaprenyl-phosphate GlcNAc-1-phosphate transferase
MFELNVLPASAITFAITIAFMVALRPLAKSIGLVDTPGGRKAHIGDIPIIGGLAMFIGVLSGVVVLGVASSLTIGLVFSFFLLVLIGAFDDMFSVPATVRVLVQVAAVLLMAYSSGLFLISIGDPFGTGEIRLGPFTLLGTLVVAVTVVNAYNLVDGVDGLAGSLALVALIAVSIIGGPGALSTAIAMIVGASIFGFLIFNFPVIANRPIRAFMGDAGSTLLGFTIFWVTIGVSQGENAIISPVVGLWLASIPVYDCLTCFVRRIKAGKSPFTPGRDHFHHSLKRGGFGVRQTLGILAGIQAVYAIAAITAHKFDVPDYLLFGAWCILGLSQRKVIRAISKQHRLYMLKCFREGNLSPYYVRRVRKIL